MEKLSGKDDNKYVDPPANQLKEISTIFSNLKVDWGIHAGFGMILHNIQRRITDVDIIINPNHISLEKLEEEFQKHLKTVFKDLKIDLSDNGYHNEEHDIYYRGKLLKLSFSQPKCSYHIFSGGYATINLSKPFKKDYQTLIVDNELFQRRLEKPYKNIILPVLALEDIALYKVVLQRGKKHDKCDISDLVSILQENLDLNYLERRIGQIGCFDRFFEFLKRNMIEL